MSVDIEDYVSQLSQAHGIQGHTTLSDGTIVYAAYRDGSYELCTPDKQLTNTEKDLVRPQRLDGRDTLLALRDYNQNEQFDLVEVNPQTGALTPILDDEYLNQVPKQNPQYPDQLAFLSNRDQSLDLYTVDIDGGDISKHSEVEAPVAGFDWGPDGTQLVYQAGLLVQTSLRRIDLEEGTDSAFINEPDSEQSLVRSSPSSHDAWTDDGIVFTTNHDTGYRELAVANADGGYDLQYVNERDKYLPRWTSNGDIVFIEPRGGDQTIRRHTDDGVTVIEDEGMNQHLTLRLGDVYYTQSCPSTAGALKREGETIVDESSLEVPTVNPTEVTYRSSGGKEISARLYTPDSEPIGGIVSIHGGPASQHYNYHAPIPQSLVQAGFEVLAPDYRGSLGYGREFRTANNEDLGGGDLDDIVAGAEFLRDRGHSQVAAMGGSYGGYLTLLAVGKTDAFDAGGSLCGIVNWETALENTRGFLGSYLQQKMGGTPEDAPELYKQRSPITYADEIDVPLLVVQGANDPRVPVDEAEQLVAKLDEDGIPHDYLLFEDEGHGIMQTENRSTALRRFISLFESEFQKQPRTP